MVDVSAGHYETCGAASCVTKVAPLVRVAQSQHVQRALEHKQSLTVNA
jgi:hypothetical protein